MSRYYGFLNESFDKMYLQETTSNISAELDAAYEGWYYTIVGAGGNLEDWKKGIQDLLTKENIGTITKWIDFKGKDMNDKYGLTGDNRYPEDLTFLAFAIDGLDVGKLAIFKLRMGDRWFTDIVDNDRRREGYDDDASDLDESLKEAKISPEDARDNEILKNIYKTRYSNKNAKLSAEEKELLAKNNLYANKRWIADNDSHVGIGDAQFKNDKHNHIDALRKKPSRYKSKD